MYFVLNHTYCTTISTIFSYLLSRNNFILVFPGISQYFPFLPKSARRYLPVNTGIYRPVFPAPVFTGQPWTSTALTPWSFSGARVLLERICPIVYIYWTLRDFPWLFLHFRGEFAHNRCVFFHWLIPHLIFSWSNAVIILGPWLHFFFYIYL